MHERWVAKTVEVVERELQRLWGDGGAGGGDGDESVYGGATCARSVNVRSL